MNDPRKFKAPYIPKERIWQEADRLRAAHPAGHGLPVKVLDLAEFDLHLDLVPVNGLREQLDIDALLMGDLIRPPRGSRQVRPDSGSGCETIAIEK